MQRVQLNSITSMQRDVSFIPAVCCGSSSGSTDLLCQLTWHFCGTSTGIYCAYLAFLLYQHCLRKPLAAKMAKMWPKNQQHNWSILEACGGCPFPVPLGTVTHWLGHQQDCIIIPGIHLLLDEFSCSKEEGAASEAVTAPAGFKLPSRNNHWPLWEFFREKPWCMYPHWVLCIYCFNDEP